MRRAMLNNEIIDLGKLTKPEMAGLARQRDFFCLMCKNPVIFKNGTRKRAHFAHKTEGVVVSHPESATHILVKHSMARWLKEQGIDAVIEKRFTTIDRIADVYFEYKKLKYVIEVQKSSMSDSEFKQRILDYQSVDVSVLWIFLGDVVKKENTFRLPPVMLGRGSEQLFHFCVKTAQLRVFEAPVFITTRDVYAKTVCLPLREFQVDDLVKIKEDIDSMYFDETWFGVKKYFRLRGWFYATKSEKKLLEQCLIRGFNLSLLPTEIGWPVAGDAIGKHLFIWQSYVLLTLMKHFSLGDVFEVGDLIKLLEMEYQMITCQGVYEQVMAYLKWLVMFGIIKKQQGHFEYVKLPRITTNMDAHLQRDKRFVEVVAKLWQV